MSWVDDAARAKAMLPKQMSYGQKQKSMAEVAGALGLARQSLRNILFAHDFLLSIESFDDAAYRALSETPYSAVEIYSRWATYDRRAALEHAIWARKRGASVKSVIADEKAARGRAKGIDHTASNLERLIGPSSVLLRLREDVSHLLGKTEERGPDANWVIRDSASGLAQAMMIRRVLIHSRMNGVDAPSQENAPFEGSPEIGILEMGERTLTEAYRKDAKDFLARAIAGSILYPLVLVIAPDEGALASLTAALPEPFGQSNSLGKAGLVIPKQCLGGIMFTCWGTIERDLGS